MRRIGAVARFGGDPQLEAIPDLDGLIPMLSPSKGPVRRRPKRESRARSKTDRSGQVSNRQTVDSPSVSPGVPSGRKGGCSTARLSRTQAPCFPSADAEGETGRVHARFPFGSCVLGHPGDGSLRVSTFSALCGYLFFLAGSSSDAACVLSTS